MQNTLEHHKTLIFRKNAFEHAAWAQNRLICGVDEVGRGCLAGPLVTAAVLLHPGKKSRLIKDSKLLTAQERLKAYAWITRHSWYGIGIVHHRLIDQYNIWQATLIAMKKAVIHALALAPSTPEFILIDAMPLSLAHTSYAEIPVRNFIKGESKSDSIAAASIIAKVTRDAMMNRFDTLFPGYHLAQHKGYSTPLHKESLRHQQYSIIHRKSFLRHIPTLDNPNPFATIAPTLEMPGNSKNSSESSHEHQQTLC